MKPEHLLEKVFEAKEYNEDDGFWFISIVNLRAIINTLTEPEDECPRCGKGEGGHQEVLGERICKIRHPGVFATTEDEPEGWQKEMMADYVRDDGCEQEDK